MHATSVIRRPAQLLSAFERGLLAVAVVLVLGGRGRGNDDGPPRLLAANPPAATDPPSASLKNEVTAAAATAPVVEARPSSTDSPGAGAAMASDSDDSPGMPAHLPPPARQATRESRPTIRPLPSRESHIQPNEIAKNGTRAARTGSTIDNLPPLPPLAIDQMAFKGITPGVSTSDELTKLWGEGATGAGQDGPTHLVYKIEPYRRVEVTLADGKVAVISVRLEKPFEPEALAKQLHLGDSISVTVFDDAGAPLGQAIPERGILLSFAPGTKLVTQMLLEPIDAEPFVLRAANETDAAPRRALRDLDFAMSLDPRLAKALAVRSQILAASGRYDDALGSIQAAIELDSKDLSHLLAKAEILGHLDRHA
ncbi:MAG TPA: hypothetical protein VGH32_05965, partial [Pirellulales bacterium]